MFSVLCVNVLNQQRFNHGKSLKINMLSQWYRFTGPNVFNSLCQCSQSTKIQPLANIKDQHVEPVCFRRSRKQAGRNSAWLKTLRHGLRRFDIFSEPLCFQMRQHLLAPTPVSQWVSGSVIDISDWRQLSHLRALRACWFISFYDVNTIGGTACPG